MCLFTAILILAVMIYPAPEPAHLGRSLSFWVEQYRVEVQSNELGDERDRKVAEAQEAIGAIGAKGLPFLVYWAKYEPLLPGSRFGSWLPLRFSHAIDRAFLSQDKLNRAEAAMQTLQMLGTNAAPAIQGLAFIIKNTKRKSKERRVEYALSWLGPEALPIMLNLWSNATSVDKSFLSVLISSHMIPTINTRDQLPLLLPMLQTHNEPLRSATYTAVSRIAPDLLTNTPAQ